jgi:dipeptidyl aminopeptidase/acylaminoacyl peptidase
MVEPLIPRRKIFGNPSFVDPTLSPDGKWLSWGAPVDGVLNIWFASLDDIKSAEPLTRTTGMPIWGHFWSGDGAYIGYSNDENGDENNHILLVDPKTKELRDMTPVTGVAAQFVASSWMTPREAAIGLNDRDARWHDTYRLNLDTGERQLIYENSHGFDFVMTDAQLHPRLARSTVADGASVYWKIDQGSPVEFMRLSYEDSMLTRPISFSPDGTKLLMCSTVGRNTSALVERDWQSGAERTIVSHPKFDIDGLWLNPKTFEPQLVGVNGKGDEWIYVSNDVETDWSKVREDLKGFTTHITSSSLDDKNWILLAHKPEQGATYFHFDRAHSNMQELFRARPEMKQYKLAPMQLIEAKSRDGLDLYSLLTLPADVKGKRPKQPLPLILSVHGGPWAQDYFGFNSEHQWLANRGYAVLSVNYRASTGYGKAFIAAGEKEHAGKMHEDLIDMVNWAIGEHVADPKKVAITGASYGGYASFVGATFTPDVFCCSVPVVGITNLQTLLESMPPYWAGFADFMYRSYGDPRTEAGRILLAERSPIYKVDNIKKPMMIFHGLNDVRCKITESDTIVAAMQAKNIPVTYVVYPDEGHGFSRNENQLSYYAIVESFFAKHLGGRCEPFGDDLEGSSHEIRAGSLVA